MEHTINWLIFLITFLIGYFLGQGKINKESTVGLIEQANKKLDSSRVGAIRQPTARDIYLKNHPSEKAGMEAMADDLKEKGI